MRILPQSPPSCLFTIAIYSNRTRPFFLFFPLVSSIFLNFRLKAHEIKRRRIDYSRSFFRFSLKKKKKKKGDSRTNSSFSSSFASRSNEWGTKGDISKEGSRDGGRRFLDPDFYTASFDGFEMRIYGRETLFRVRRLEGS